MMCALRAFVLQTTLTHPRADDIFVAGDGTVQLRLKDGLTRTSRYGATPDLIAAARLHERGACSCTALRSRRLVDAWDRIAWLSLYATNAGTALSLRFSAGGGS